MICLQLVYHGYSWWQISKGCIVRNWNNLDRVEERSVNESVRGVLDECCISCLSFYTRWGNKPSPLTTRNQHNNILSNGETHRSYCSSTENVTLCCWRRSRRVVSANAAPGVNTPPLQHKHRHQHESASGAGPPCTDQVVIINRSGGNRFYYHRFCNMTVWTERVQ